MTTRAKRHSADRSPVRPLPRRRENIFRQEGEYWTIIHAGTLFRLRDAKGLHYLAYLLRRPGERIHCIDLMSAMSGRRADSAASAERTRLAVTKRIKATLAKIAALHPALADYLGERIRTGYFCAYACGPARLVSWSS